MGQHVLASPLSCVGKSYKNAQGKSECVAFIQQTLDAPPTVGWKEGTKIQKNGTAILPGTAIATFVNGRYPQTGVARHAAIYMGQDDQGVRVIDQWNSKPIVSARTLRWDAEKPQNNGGYFSGIVW